MGTIFYLYKHTLKNRIRIALHKPVTYFYIVLFVVYFVMILFSLKVMLEAYEVASPSGMAAVMTAFSFWMIPGNLIAYAKRRGLIYKRSDVHFLFPTPISPKKILLYAHLRTMPTQLIMNLVIALFGGILFRVSWWQLCIYFVFSILIENLIESSIMLLLYGSERISESGRKTVIAAAYGLVGALVVIGFFFYFKETSLSGGNSVLTMAGSFLHSNAVQMVPFIGWYVSVLHLIFVGPTARHLIGTAAYLVFGTVLVVLAFRMKCTGAYFEDAMKFADDYEDLVESRKKGNTNKKLGKKQKFNSASIVYKGSGARAIFYRQLLEYKKNKFFIFDTSTLVALIAGIGCVFLYRKHEMGGLAQFMLPGMSAYLIFCFTALSGKWGKEIASPYTYLIPDSAFAKLWYATAMQHVQAVVNGILITLPGAVVMKLSPLTVILSVAFYVVLNANKLYALAVAEAAVGNVLGTMGKQLFQMFIQGAVIGFAALGAAVGMMLGGINLAYLLMILFLTAATAVFMVIAAWNFYKMETA